MGTDQNKAVVADVLKALETGDAETVLAHLAEGATWWVAGDMPISGTRDRDGIEKMISGIAAATDGPIVFRATGFVAEGDRVAVEAESELTLKNRKVYRNEYSLVFEFVADGRISRIREYTDTKKAQDLLFG